MNITIRKFVSLGSIFWVFTFCCFAQYPNTNLDWVSWDRVIHNHDWPALSRMLHSTNPTDQSYAFTAFGDYTTNLPPRLISEFESQLRNIVRSKANLLRWMPDINSRTAVRDAVAQGKTNLYPAIVFAGIDALAALRDRATNELSFLLDILSNHAISETLRERSFDAISRIAPNSSIDTEAMNICLRSESDALFKAALYRFTDFPMYRDATNFIPLLVESLSRPGNSNQWLVIQKLGSVSRDSPVGISALKLQLRSTNAENRAQAILALHNAQALTDDDIKTLGRLLFDENRHVGMNAARVLGLIGTNAVPVLPELRKAMSSGDKDVAQEAKIAVQSITPRMRN